MFILIAVNIRLLGAPFAKEFSFVSPERAVYLLTWRFAFVFDLQMSFVAGSLIASMCAELVDIGRIPKSL
jgi:hypothetical protein